MPNEHATSGHPPAPTRNAQAPREGHPGTERIATAPVLHPSRRLDAMQVVCELTQTVSRAARLEDIYTAALDGLFQATDADRAAVLVFDPDGVMRFKAWRGLSEAYRAAVEGHSPWSADESDPRSVLVESACTDPRWQSFLELFHAEGIGALAFVPLRSAGRLLGKFMLYYDAPHQFAREEVQVAETIAGQIAFAVDRTRSEARLTLYREIIAHSTDAVAIIDTHGRYLEQNAAHRALHGYDDTELRRATPAMHLGREAFEPIAEALATTGRYRGEVTSRTRTGESIEVDIAAFAVHSGSAEPLCYVGIERDITARRRAEMELRRSRDAARAAEERAMLLAEASANLAAATGYESTLASIARVAVPTIADWCVVDVVDDSGAIRRVAAAAASPDKERILRELQMRYPLEQDSFQPASEALRRRASVVFTEFTDSVLAAACKDSERLDLLRALAPRSTVSSPMIVRGSALGVMTVAWAETDRSYAPAEVALIEALAHRAALALDHARLLREAQQASRLKDEFLATVSHELRTPLTAMLGWAGMLRSGVLPEEKRQRAIEIIERNARAQAQLIEDLLDISRIVSGQLRLNVGPVELPRLIDAAMEAVRPAAEAKGVRLQSTGAQEIGPVRADAERLQQIVWNLLTNAVKFTPQGGSVRVWFERDCSCLVLGVEDTGQGIAPDFLPFVFDRFRQADAGTTRRHGGLGLGLAIVRHLVDLHGGSVEARSDGEGRGASFIVRIPVATSDAPPLVGPSVERTTVAARSLPIRLDGVRVLVVEDEADAREWLASAFARSGAVVCTAASSQQALDVLVQNVPDVIVSDIGMPDEDGYSLIRKIRTLATDRGGSVPALALTAYASRDDEARVLAAGFDAHAAKPVEFGELARRVAELRSRAAAD